MDTQDLSIAEMGRMLRAGSVTAEALARDALARVAARDGTLHAFVLVTEERALADARRADDELKSGRDRGPFHGIPYALKDIYDTAGIRTTCHSKLRLNNVPKEDSVAAARLREAGGVLLGKLATHEFAIGGPSFDLPFPPARNPWNPRSRHRRFVLRFRHRDRRRAWCAWRWARTPAVRSADRRRGAAPSASSRPTGAYRAAACFRCPGRSTTSAR